MKEIIVLLGGGEPNMKNRLQKAVEYIIDNSTIQYTILISGLPAEVEFYRKMIACTTEMQSYTVYYLNSAYDTVTNFKADILPWINNRVREAHLVIFSGSNHLWRINRILKMLQCKYEKTFRQTGEIENLKTEKIMRYAYEWGGVFGIRLFQYIAYLQRQ